MNNKFCIQLVVVVVLLITLIGTVKELMQNQYERGYAAGADSLSDKHVNEVCIQWLFQSDLEAARRKVCAK
jgi:hypothetical protein